MRADRCMVVLFWVIRSQEYIVLVLLRSILRLFKLDANIVRLELVLPLDDDYCPLVYSKARTVFCQIFMPRRCVG